jgi:UDP-galactopyranose mutase
MKHTFLIVGAGFFGATFARKAMDRGMPCLVIDKLPHTAGAAHDRRVHGINVSSYGAHVFHTHDDGIWEFVRQFGEWEPFINKPKVVAGNRIFSFPINLMTLHQVWGVRTPQEAADKLRQVRIPCGNPRNFEEWALSRIGRELYDTFIYGYTKKQYHKEPRELPASILQRLPIRLTFDENYFTARHQAMPKDGYTRVVENMLEGAEVRLGVDFFTLRDTWRRLAHHLVYTGPVDRFFDYQYGQLDHNTLRFEHQVYRGDYQGNAVMNYADEAVPYLRSVEHKHFIHPNRFKKHHDLDPGDAPTVVSFDLPIKFEDHPEPYYPLRDEKNLNLYARYAALKNGIEDVTFGGRLGEYQYFDIDQTIASATRKVERLLKGSL